MAHFPFGSVLRNSPASVRFDAGVQDDRKLRPAARVEPTAPCVQAVPVKACQSFPSPSTMRGIE